MTSRLWGFLWGASLAVLSVAWGAESVRIVEVLNPTTGRHGLGFELVGRDMVVATTPCEGGEAGARVLEGGWRWAGEDPVSKLVIFTKGAPKSVAEDFSDACGIGVHLRSADGDSVEVRSKVQQFRGRFLPFTVFGAQARSGLEAGTPLLDGKGKFAAMVSHEGEGGMVFLTPASVAERVIEDLIRFKDLRRAHLGLVLSPAQAEPRVVRVIEGSCAAGAGLKAGDVISSVADQPIRGYGDAVNAFFLLRPSREVAMEIKRAGKVEKVTVKTQPVAR